MDATTITDEQIRALHDEALFGTPWQRSMAEYDLNARRQPSPWRRTRVDAHAWRARLAEILNARAAATEAK